MKINQATAADGAQKLIADISAKGKTTESTGKPSKVRQPLAINSNQLALKGTMFPATTASSAGNSRKFSNTKTGSSQAQGPLSKLGRYSAGGSSVNRLLLRSFVCALSARSWLIARSFPVCLIDKDARR